MTHYFLSCLILSNLGSVSFAGATTSGSTAADNNSTYHSPTGSSGRSTIPLFSLSSNETENDNDNDDDDRSLFGVTHVDRGSGTVTVAKAVSATDYEAEIRRRLQQEAVIAIDVVNEDCEQIRSFSKSNGNGDGGSTTRSSEVDDDDNERRKKRKLCLTYGSIVGALVIVLIIALVVTATILNKTRNFNMFGSGGSNNSNNNNNNQVSPTVSPVNNNNNNNNNDPLIPTPPPPIITPPNDYNDNDNIMMDSDMALYYRQIIAEVLPKDSLVDTLGSIDSPQYFAFMFLIDNSSTLFTNVMPVSVSDPSFKDYEKSKAITIFSLVSLYYSTNGSNWFISTNWLNPAVDICDWHGINCKGELRGDSSMTMNDKKDAAATASTIIAVRNDERRRLLRRQTTRRMFLQQRELQTGAPEVIYDTPNDDAYSYGDPLGNPADDDYNQVDDYTPADDLVYSTDDLAGDDLVFNEETGQWEGIDQPDNNIMPNEEVVQEEDEVVDEVVDGLDDTFLIKEPSFDDDQTWFVDDIVLNQENDDDQTWFERPIRSINLMANNLIGELPNELGLLTNVYQLLNFDTNSLSGSIPSSLSMLTKLQGINFSYNQFESTIPTELGSMTEIRIFDISNNESIDGTFPTELDQWRNIGTYNI